MNSTPGTYLNSTLGFAYYCQKLRGSLTPSSYTENSLQAIAASAVALFWIEARPHSGCHVLHGKDAGVLVLQPAGLVQVQSVR